VYRCKRCIAYRGAFQISGAAPSRRYTFENWLGVFLDIPDLDWKEIAGILEEAFRTAAPKL
jgi:hypothetical protein